jgi:hypothetical protein
MILSLVALLVQAQAPAASPPADERPVRVWIDSPSPLFRGLPVRVYVRTATSGNLIVLHRRTDGRIEPLFPASPKAEAWVHAGQYEIRSSGDRPAFVLAEPDGGGMILAALTSGPIWFDEFAHDASWNPDALMASWGGADAEGALTDIVQRMLGDGAFNYDILSYAVRPAAYAQRSVAAPQAQDTVAYAPQQEIQPPQTCIDCTFIGTQIVDAPLFLIIGRGFRHRRQDRQPPCPPMTICGAPPEQLLARTMPRLGPVVGTPGVPPRGPGGRTFTTPRHGGATPAVEPRPREETTTAAVLPLVPGRPVRGSAGERPPVATAASRSALALRYVRARPLATATPVAEGSDPREDAPAPRTGTITTPASLLPRGGGMTYRVPRTEQSGTQTFARPRTNPSGIATTGTEPVQPRPVSGTFSVPMAASRGGAVRSTVIRSRLPRP